MSGLGEYKKLFISQGMDLNSTFIDCFPCTFFDKKNKESGCLFLFNNNICYASSDQLNVFVVKNTDIIDIKKENSYLFKKIISFSQVQNNEINQYTFNEFENINQTYDKLEQVLLNSFENYNGSQGGDLKQSIIMNKKTCNIKEKEIINKMIRENKTKLKLNERLNQRASRIKQQVTSRNDSIASLKEIIVPDLTLKEAYLLFFSNSEFIYGKENFQCFYDYYLQDAVKANNIKISQLEPNPPDYFNYFYINNSQQIQDYDIFSKRSIAFENQGKIFKCKENIYWLSDKQIIVERCTYLNNNDDLIIIEFINLNNQIIDNLTLNCDIKIVRKQGQPTNSFKKSIIKELTQSWENLTTNLNNISEKYNNDTLHDPNLIRKVKSQQLQNNKQKIQVQGTQTQENPIDNEEFQIIGVDDIDVKSDDSDFQVVDDQQFSNQYCQIF